MIRVKGESDKAGLNFNIQKKKIMAPCSISSWQIDGETKETLTGFNFFGSKITADGNYSHDIKRHSLEEAMSNLDSILKSRDITFLTKVRLVKAMVFPVVILESWTINEAGVGP